MSEEIKKEVEVTTLYSILKKANDFKQEKRRLDYLKSNERFELITVLQGNFNKKINFKFPEGAPPYKPKEDPVELDKKHFNFAPCVNFQSHQWERESKFINILQSVDAKDAEIIIAMKDKKLSEMFPKITYETVKQLWPQLL